MYCVYFIFCYLRKLELDINQLVIIDNLLFFVLHKDMRQFVLIQSSHPTN